MLSSLSLTFSLLALLECTPKGCLAVTLLIFMAFNGAFCLVAAILCAIEVNIKFLNCC